MTEKNERLAEEIATLDHLTKGRFIAGLGRGYQDRWVKVLGQHYDVAGATSDDSERDRHNREVFEELYALLKPFHIRQYYTDGWGAYQRILPADLHTVTKREEDPGEATH